MLLRKITKLYETTYICRRFPKTTHAVYTTTCIAREEQQKQEHSVHTSEARIPTQYIAVSYFSIDDGFAHGPEACSNGAVAFTKAPVRQTTCDGFIFLLGGRLVEGALRIDVLTQCLTLFLVGGGGGGDRRKM